LSKGNGNVAQRGEREHEGEEWERYGGNWDSQLWREVSLIFEKSSERGGGSLTNPFEVNRLGEKEKKGSQHDLVARLEDERRGVLYERVLQTLSYPNPKRRER